MKRYLLFSLLVIIISSLLCSCILFRDPTPWEEGKQKDTLFSSELLAEWKIEELQYYFIEGSICTISAYESREDYNEENEYIHLVVFENEEYAKAYNAETQFNVATWLVFAMCGEPRWLHTERYGNVCVEYYPRSFMKPFNEIINTK